MDTTTARVDPPEGEGGGTKGGQLEVARKGWRGVHEVLKAEVLAKGQVENTARDCHELPASMADVCATALHDKRGKVSDACQVINTEDK